MSVRHESLGRVTTVILDPPDGRPAGAAEALATDLANRGAAREPGASRRAGGLRGRGRCLIA